MRTIETCPFCGRNVKLLESNGWHWIECECGMSTDWEPDEDRLVAMWNRRIKPEQKKGKWQRRKGSDCWECSQCHAVLEDFDLKLHNYYFCYHCGTNMMTTDGWINIKEVKHE